MLPDNPYAASETASVAVPHTPLTVGGTLSAALNVLTERFGAICLIILALWLPAELISSYATYELIDEDAGSLPLLLDQVFELLVGSFVAGTIIHLSSSSLLREPIPVTSAMGRALMIWPLLIANRILFSIVCSLGFILLIIPGLYLMIRLTLVDVVTVMEKQSGTESLSRSFELTKPHFGFTFLMCCFFFFVAIAFMCLIIGPQILFPDLDTWYLDALVTTAYDGIAAFFQICSVVMWNDMRHNERKVPFQLRVPVQ